MDQLPLLTFKMHDFPPVSASWSHLSHCTSHRWANKCSICVGICLGHLNATYVTYIIFHSTAWPHAADCWGHLLSYMLRHVVARYRIAPCVPFSCRAWCPWQQIQYQQIIGAYRCIVSFLAGVSPFKLGLKGLSVPTIKLGTQRPGTWGFIFIKHLLNTHCTFLIVRTEDTWTFLLSDPEAEGTYSSVCCELKGYIT